jgi:hypothetical protein
MKRIKVGSELFCNSHFEETKRYIFPVKIVEDLGKDDNLNYFKVECKNLNGDTITFNTWENCLFRTPEKAGVAARKRFKYTVAIDMDNCKKGS